MTSIRAFAGVFAVVVTGFGCAASAEVVDEPGASTESAAKIDCSYVKCAVPECAPGQHIVQAGCCGVCRGPVKTDCSLVLCAAVVCNEGEHREFAPNDCCGRCVADKNVAECKTDLDCPQIACIRCPCPTSSCVGRKCVTKTADVSTCGAE